MRLHFDCTLSCKQLVGFHSDQQSHFAAGAFSRSVASRTDVPTGKCYHGLRWFQCMFVLLSYTRCADVKNRFLLKESLWRTSWRVYCRVKSLSSVSNNMRQWRHNASRHISRWLNARALKKVIYVDIRSQCPRMSPLCDSLQMEEFRQVIATCNIYWSKAKNWLPS